MAVKLPGLLVSPGDSYPAGIASAMPARESFNDRGSATLACRIRKHPLLEPLEYSVNLHTAQMRVMYYGDALACFPAKSRTLFYFVFLMFSKQKSDAAMIALLVHFLYLDAAFEARIHPRSGEQTYIIISGAQCIKNCDC
jgi:hypothetical protein